MTEPTISGQFARGLVECLVAFGVTLANRGLIERGDLARAFRLQVEQLRRQPFADQAEFDARVAAPLALAEFFETPVANGPIVIKGGKTDPPPK